jgi:hypothetical protein
MAGKEGCVSTNNTFNAFPGNQKSGLKNWSNGLETNSSHKLQYELVWYWPWG